MSSHCKSSDGDWICSDLRCGNLNFAWRSCCNKCGKQKEINSDAFKKKQGIEIGKVAAEKSHGLFSAEDWQCTKCGNVNWARRQTCNMCNAPKVGEVEERTGYGGGFNEREGVEYIERADSDDEFDEFGRRKKKFRSGPSPNGKDKDESFSQPRDEAVNKKKKKIDDIDDEGDDDEDEDDDEDLSKYDLVQDDDDDDKEEDEKEEDVKKTKSEKELNSSSKVKSDSRSSSASPNSRHSSRLRCHSSSKDRSSSRDSSRRSPKRYRDRSRSRERRRKERRASRSRSRSNSRSRSYSRDKRYSRR